MLYYENIMYLCHVKLHYYMKIYNLINMFIFCDFVLGFHKTQYIKIAPIKINNFIIYD